MKQEKYKLKHTEKQIKQDINDLFVNDTTKNTTALILDAENLFTTRKLIKNKVKPKNIYVPNPFSYDDLIKYSKQHKIRINIFNKLLYNFLIDDFSKLCESLKNELFIWFDYCCCFMGNDNINPREDIKTMFEILRTELNTQQHIGLTIKFSVTFSYRKPTSDFKHERYIEIINYITRTAYKYGFVAIPTIHRIYKMYYIEFIVKRIGNEVYY